MEESDMTARVAPILAPAMGAAQDAICDSRRSQRWKTMKL